MTSCEHFRAQENQYTNTISFKVRQRKTFLKVGQSLLARKDLELETQFKDHMIQSVMPKKVISGGVRNRCSLSRTIKQQSISGGR